jgi:hypothetical protein
MYSDSDSRRTIAGLQGRGVHGVERARRPGRERAAVREADRSLTSHPAIHRHNPAFAACMLAAGRPGQ